MAFGMRKTGKISSKGLNKALGTQGVASPKKGGASTVAAHTTLQTKAARVARGKTLIGKIRNRNIDTFGETRKLGGGTSKKK